MGSDVALTSVASVGGLHNKMARYDDAFALRVIGADLLSIFESLLDNQLLPQYNLPCRSFYSIISPLLLEMENSINGQKYLEMTSILTVATNPSAGIRVRLEQQSATSVPNGIPAAANGVNGHHHDNNGVDNDATAAATANGADGHHDTSSSSSEWVVAEVGIAYGGVAPKSIMAEKVG